MADVVRLQAARHPLLSTPVAQPALDRIRLGTPTALGWLLAALLLVPIAASAETLSSLDVQVSLAALPEKPGSWEAVAIVSDGSSGAFLAAPFLRFGEGETAVATAQAQTGEQVSLSIGPVIGGERANWLVVVRRDGEVVARARGVVFAERDD